MMLQAVVAFLVLLNPFAMFLYLQPVMRELRHRDFVRVFIRANLISFVIFFVFLLSQDWLFNTVLQINFESFRIFGGILFFSLAYLFIVKGQRALVQMRANLDEVANEIALPFMIGPATISLTVLMGKQFGIATGAMLLLLVLVINFALVLAQKYTREHLEKRKMKEAFDRNMEILMRLNGFFLGAIGVNMVVTGISNLYFL